MNEVDFTSCRRVSGRAYNGANGKKLAVEWRGACWILKFPPSAAERPNDLSYSNSCFSEHLASTIFRMLGIRTQEFDRHNGNWGFLVDRATGLAEIAPVFDCGSCLLPQADERIMRKMLSDKAELEARIYMFPSSMLKIGGEKIGYARFLADPPEDLKSAIDRIVPRIDMPAISSFVDEVPYLTDLQRVFYKTYLLARYDRLLRPFAKKTCHLRHENG